ncbi:FtsK/SpoIIIE domain-containing protein [Streptomyces flavidovirens]|uniref:FtsK/SpoIIIE domain-containing protein n=1 Tax=Streptomyces flavidovirens TaxID=67298 RepID=UPI003F576B79
MVLITQPKWQDRFDEAPWRWYLVGFPVTALRLRFTWRKLCQNSDLAVSRRPRQALMAGELLVKGSAVRPVPPRLGPIRATRTGLVVRIRLHPGQTPGQFIAAAEAFTHAWRVHSVRVISPERGEVAAVITARDPLSDRPGVMPVHRPRVLAATVGRTEDGAAWEIDLRVVPHWLVIGATRSGKSNWLATLIGELAPQPVALVGIDCKGGMELALFAPRLSALASNRADASRLLAALLTEAEDRMAECRAAGARSIWDLPEEDRPVPVVVVVDEIAELYLSDGSRASKAETAECSTSLLRLGQLGAALGIHLVVAAQRFGSELGPGVTALRAQLGGRVCHRAHDEATAEMALGDLAPDAVAVAQSITEAEQGVAVTTIGGHWLRARSLLTTIEGARSVSREHAHRTPCLPVLGPSLTKGGTA